MFDDNLKSNNMKKLLILGLFLLVSMSFAQEKTVKRPKWVIIANDQIIEKKDLNNIAMKNIKSMNKGVSEERRDELFDKLGEKIGGREFIMEIILLSDEEILEKEKNNKNKDEISSSSKTKAVFKRNKSKPVKTGFELKANEIAPDFEVQMVDGTSIKLSELKGKVVLLNFWATWCGPCIMEFYDIPDTILDKFKGQEFVFIPVSIGESKDKVLKKIKTLRKDGIKFNVGYDTDKALWSKYATHSIPKNFLIDQNGVIRYVSTGYSEKGLQKLALEIEKLLKK